MNKLITLLAFLTLTSTTMASSPLIIGGTEVQGNDWENVIAITDTEGNIFCSGTAMDSKTISTAAHCLVGDDISEYVASELFPLLVAIDLPNTSLEEFVKMGLSEEQAQPIVKIQQFIKADPALFTKTLGEEEAFLEKIQDVGYRYNYIAKKFREMLDLYATQVFRIYVGLGNEGGKVEAGYKVRSVEIDPYYLQQYSVKTAESLGIEIKGGFEAKGPVLDRLILTLEEDLPISNFVPALSPKEMDDVDYKSVRLVGFGRTVAREIKKEDENFGIKREVTVDLVGYVSNISTYVTHTPNKSACHGDSGGAAFVKLQSSGEWRYLGIISSGIGFNGVKGSQVVFDTSDSSSSSSQCGSSKIATLIVPAV